MESLDLYFVVNKANHLFDVLLFRHFLDRAVLNLTPFLLQSMDLSVIFRFKHRIMPHPEPKYLILQLFLGIFDPHFLINLLNIPPFLINLNHTLIQGFNKRLFALIGIFLLHYGEYFRSKTIVNALKYLFLENCLEVLLWRFEVFAVHVDVFHRHGLTLEALTGWARVLRDYLQA